MPDPRLAQANRNANQQDNQQRGAFIPNFQIIEDDTQDATGGLVDQTYGQKEAVESEKDYMSILIKFLKG